MAIQQTHPLDALNNVISDICGNIDQYKKNPSDFTRNRKLPVDQLIKTTLNMQGQSLEAELLKAYPDLDDRMTKSAYEQQKNKLKPEIFEDIFHQYNDTLEQPKTLDVVNSYRVLAIDGSDFNPPYQSKSEYAVTYTVGRPKKDGTDSKPFSQVHVNMLYNLMDKTYQDAVLQPRSQMDERDAAITMLKRLDNSTPFIVIMDRGYDGFNMIETLNRIENCNYIIRTKAGACGIKEIQNLPDEECDTEMEFEITASRTFFRAWRDEKPHLKYMRHSMRHYKEDRSKNGDNKRWDFEQHCFVKCRVVKFRINDPDTGLPEWEVLITNLNRFEFPLEKMKELYHLRWGIETSFLNLKYAIGAVQFHSRKDDFIKMELFAHFTMFNVVSRCINQTSVPQNRSHKHTYAIEFKMAVAVVRKYFRKHNLTPYNLLFAEILQYRIPVRPNRKDTRKTIKPKSAVWFVYRVA